MSLLRQSPAKPTLLSRSPRNLTFVAKPITFQLLLSPRPAVRRDTMSSVFLVPSGQRPHRQLVRLRALHMVTGCTKASSRNHNHASSLPCHPHCWLWPKHHQFLPQRLPTGKLLAPKQIGQIPASSLTPKHRALSRRLTPPYTLIHACRQYSVSSPSRALVYLGGAVVLVWTRRDDNEPSSASISQVPNR